jgi:3-oxoacyl-[acyl-carrier protein] reductase
MDISLKGRSAIVTGSARRIGRAIAFELASCGAAVLINSRSDTAAAQATAEQIVAKGGRASFCVADVTKPDDVRRMVGTAVDAFGGLDILVNNAAVRPNEPLEAISVEKWREVLAVVLDGSFLCAQACAPHLKRSNQGRVINIGGTSAHKGVTNRIHVMTAKSGLVGLTKGLAMELAPHATANCVVPGLIEDEQDEQAEVEARRKRMPPELVPVGRTGAPKDIAGMVAFLCSDAGGYITGQTIHVSGGLYLP